MTGSEVVRVRSHGTSISYTPYAKGNGLRLGHGARSPRVYGELARLLVDGLLADRPDLANYPEALARWATSEAQALLMRRHTEQVGLIDPETSEPREGIARHLRQFEKDAAKYAEALGLDPISDARLHKERANAMTESLSLEALMEKGRAMRAAREAAGVIDEPDDLAGEVLARVRATARQAEIQADLEHLL